MSAWLSISERARLVKGESVLILGATGVAGQLAIQVARHLGARRIVAAGRNLEALASENLDGVVSLTQGDDAIREAFSVEAGKGIDVVIDYLWGRPTELLLEALAKRFDPNAAQATRLVELGESAGKTITLPGATLRSIDLKLMGGGFCSCRLNVCSAAIPTLFELAATGSSRSRPSRFRWLRSKRPGAAKESGRRIVFNALSAPESDIYIKIHT